MTIIEAVTADETDLIRQLRLASDGKQFEVRSGGSAAWRPLTIEQLMEDLLPDRLAAGAALERLKAGHRALIAIIDDDGERTIRVR